jgi:peptidoglycan/LPS O-acetylase OafA/YrhL
MVICVNCGIELDDGLKVCPLCGRDQENVEQEHIPGNYPSDIIQLHKKENRKHLWELSGIIAFSGIAVCTIVDLTINKKLGWSLLSDVSIAAAWIIVTLFLFTHKRSYILVPLLMLTILAALFFIDSFTGPMIWFLPVGFPITIAAFIAIGAIITLYRAAHFKGLNIIAAALVILSGFCIITEMALDKYINGLVDLRWSLIAAISILPVALIFLFYHYRLKKGNRLDSFFHI